MTRKEYLNFINQVWDEIEPMIGKKQYDYASEEDAFINFRSAEDMGLTCLHGIVWRMGDKWQRVHSFLKNGNLQNEGVEDAFRDFIGYSLLALGVLEDGKTDISKK
jgi:hypothetical protein